MTDENIKRLYMDDETKKDFERAWVKSFYRQEDRKTQIIPKGIVVPTLQNLGSETG